MHHTKSEILENGNEWYCSSCQKHQKAMRKVTFWKNKLPKILILSLKRFEFRDLSNNNQSGLLGSNNNSHREKIEDFIDIPLEGLNMKEFCYLNNQNNSNNKIDSEINDNNCIYDLFAICNHFGRMGFGHYTAFARDYVNNELSSQWYLFDDDIVRKCINPNEVNSKAAYILFYRQRN